MPKERNSTPQNATLSPAQEAAIAALLGGSSVVDAANTSGVDRTTVHRWLREDFVFQAELNGRRKELRFALQDRLTQLANKATACVETAIEGGDLRTSVTLLRSLGILGPLEIGSDDAEALRVQRKEARMSMTFRDLAGF